MIHVLMATLLACSIVDAQEVGNWNRAAIERLENPPLGLPPVTPRDDNPPTLAKIALGRKLFLDRRLSRNGTMSCAMCHIPEQGFTNNELSTPVGIEGRSLRRNAPTLLNVAYAVDLFLDGRETSLESQVNSPLLHPDEMANRSAGAIIAKILNLHDYDGLFERAFAGGPSIERVALSIASWERTLLAGDSPFDRWHYGGENDALTTEARRGWDQPGTGRRGLADLGVLSRQGTFSRPPTRRPSRSARRRSHVALWSRPRRGRARRVGTRSRGNGAHLRACRARRDGAGHEEETTLRSLTGALLTALTR